MWQQLLSLGRKLFSLTARVDKLEETDAGLRQDIVDLRRDLNELNDRVDRLAGLLQVVYNEHRHDRDRSEDQRKILLLEIKTRFLRHERGVPSRGGAFGSMSTAV